MNDFVGINQHRSESIFLSSGFRVRKSNTAGYVVRSKREAFASIEVYDQYYDYLDLDPQKSIVLWHEEKGLVDGNWQLSPNGIPIAIRTI